MRQRATALDVFYGTEVVGTVHDTSPLAFEYAPAGLKRKAFGDQGLVPGPSRDRFQGLALGRRRPFSTTHVHEIVDTCHEPVLFLDLAIFRVPVLGGTGRDGQTVPI